MREVLPLKPELQLSFRAVVDFDESDSCVALLVSPRHYALNFHATPGSGQCKADSHRTGYRQQLLHADSHASLAEVHQMSFKAPSGSVGKRDRHIQRLTVIAQPPIQNHIP